MLKLDRTAGQLRNLRPCLLVVLSVAILVLCAAVLAEAADRPAASCSRDDVQAVINAAVSGDRVLVPAGSCTWTASVTISGRNVTLEGSGKAHTIILISGVTNAVDLSTTSSRVTGFRFNLINGDHIIEARGRGWRVDNNIFDNQIPSSNRVGVRATGDNPTPHPRGVVDSNEFFNARVLVLGDLSLLYGASREWAEPLALGTDNAVFVEDNVFTWTSNSNTMDSNYGGRYVFRYNRVKGPSSADTHSVQGEGRASRSFEIYENTFEATTPFFTCMFLRGGTGVVFKNQCNGPYTRGISLDNVRSFEARGVAGICAGASAWDGNASPPGNGWPCRDQIGRSSDVFVWTSQKPTPPQASDPVYFWDNTKDASVLNPVVVNNTSHHIQVGRDYLVSGPKPGYTPFTYPHPVRSAGSTPAPAAPIAPRIVY